jgi:hypothetical protein
MLADHITTLTTHIDEAGREDVDQDNAVVVAAVKAIRVSCEGKDTWRGSFASLGGIDPLVTILQSENEDIQREALETLAEMALNGENRFDIVEQGGVAACLDLIADSSCPVVTMHACNLLNNLACSHQVRTFMATVEDLKLVLLQLVHCCTDCAALKHALAAIWTLCLNEDIANQFVANDAHVILLKHLHSPNLEVQEQAAGALW